MSTTFTRGENPLRADKLNTAFDERLLKGGDTMQGPLFLSRDPLQSNEAVTKQYLDGAFISGVPGNVYLPLTGGTVTGPVVFNGNLTGSGFGTAIGKVLGPLENFNASGFPGMHQSSRLIWSRSTAAVGDFADWQFNRTVNYTGGTTANANSVNTILSTVNSNVGTVERGGLDVISTSSTGGGLIVGRFTQANRLVGGKDKIFGFIAETNDQTGVDSLTNSNQQVSQEIDLRANKADNAANAGTFGGAGIRKGLNIVFSRYDTGDVTPAHFTNLLWFTQGVPTTNTYDSFAYVDSAIGFGVNTQVRQALDTRGAIVPTGVTDPMAAVRMSAGHVIDFNGGALLTSAPGRWMYYDGTKLRYMNGASTEMFSSTDTTNVFSIGSSAQNRVTITPGAAAPVIASTGASGLNIQANNNAVVGVLSPLSQTLTKVLASHTTNSATSSGFFFNQNFSGTSNITAGQNFLNSFQTVDTSTAIGGTLTTYALAVNMNYGGASSGGAKSGMLVQIADGQGAAGDTGADNFYVALATACFGNNAHPGATSGAPLGRLFGMNPTANAITNAANLFQVTSAEFNVALKDSATAFIRAGISIADLASTKKGYGVDNAIWIYGQNAASWSYGIMFGDQQLYDIDRTSGTFIGMRVGNTTDATTQPAAKWGVDFMQVAFPATGTPGDGSFLRSRLWSVDGQGTTVRGSCYTSWSSTGQIIDAKGSVGTSAAINTAGSGYVDKVGVGQRFAVTTALGGLWSVTPNAGGVPTSIAQLTEPLYPTTTPPAGATTNVATICQDPAMAARGASGLTINITWNTTAVGLSLQPTAGGKLGFYGTAPIIKQTGVAVTAAGIHAALTALGLIAP